MCNAGVSGENVRVKNSGTEHSSRQLLAPSSHHKTLTELRAQEPMRIKIGKEVWVVPALFEECGAIGAEPTLRLRYFRTIYDSEQDYSRLWVVLVNESGKDGWIVKPLVSNVDGKVFASDFATVRAVATAYSAGCALNESEERGAKMVNVLDAYAPVFLPYHETTRRLYPHLNDIHERSKNLQRRVAEESARADYEGHMLDLYVNQERFH